MNKALKNKNEETIVITSKEHKPPSQRIEGKLLLDYNFKEDSQKEEEKSSIELQVSDSMYQSMMPALRQSFQSATMRNNESLKLGRSFFIPKVPELGIGEKLSPGRYKLLQGQPDMTKRNKSQFSTFGAKELPLTWRKNLVSKVKKLKDREEKR